MPGAMLSPDHFCIIAMHGCSMHSPRVLCCAWNCHHNFRRGLPGCLGTKGKAPIQIACSTVFVKNTPHSKLKIDGQKTGQPALTSQHTEAQKRGLQIGPNVAKQTDHVVVVLLFVCARYLYNVGLGGMVTRMVLGGEGTRVNLSFARSLLYKKNFWFLCEHAWVAVRCSSAGAGPSRVAAHFHGAISKARQGRQQHCGTWDKAFASGKI
jgi:hypothetical protein